VKGVLYRSGSTITIGSSDGLQIWSGRWESDGVRLKMTYRLKSYQVAFTGAEEATRKDIHAQAIPQADRLRFAVPEVGVRSFEPASRLPGTLEERFLECQGQPAPATPASH
jgi:hypothetical protein